MIYPHTVLSQIIPSEFPPFSPKIVVLTRKPREKGRPTLATNPHHWGQDPHYYSYWRSPLIPIPGHWMLLEATFSGRCLWLYYGSIDHISYSKPKEGRKVNSTTTRVIEYDRILSHIVSIFLGAAILIFIDPIIKSIICPLNPDDTTIFVGEASLIRVEVPILFP